jgi:hypothetical protein
MPTMEETGRNAKSPLLKFFYSLEKKYLGIVWYCAAQGFTVIAKLNVGHKKARHTKTTILQFNIFL